VTTLFIISLLILIGFLLLGMNIPFAFGGALIFIIIAADIPLNSIILWGFNEITSPVLLAVPLFILFGSIVSVSGIADKILKAINVFIGRIQGALGIIVILASGILGAISGSAFTGIAAVGPIMIPQMREQGLSRGYATSLVSVSSLLGVLIPPSIPLIIYGWATGTTVLGSFLSTVGPGVLLIILFSIINVVYTRKTVPNSLESNGVIHNNKEYEDKKQSTDFLSVEPVDMVNNKDYSVTKPSKSKTFLIAIPGLLMPVIILGGIYGGFFTPTEAAAIAGVLSILIGFFIYRELTVKNLYSTLKESTSSIGAIMSMIVLSLFLSQSYVQLRIPQELVELFVSFTESKTAMLIIVSIFLLFVGMVINDSTAMILTAPLLLPLVVSYGVDPIHFAAIMTVNLAMGGITPPYASILYFGMRTGNAKFSEVIKPTLLFLLMGYLPVLIITVFWEPLAMFLPNLFGY